MRVPKILYHYTIQPCVGAILSRDVILPSPPLEYHRLNREEVEADPSRFGFATSRSFGRRKAYRGQVPDPVRPEVVHTLAWLEGQRFLVHLTAEDWCRTALGTLPGDEAGDGVVFRLIVPTEGLRLFGWRDFQQVAGVPPAYRRSLADQARRLGDEVSAWWFSDRPVPIYDRVSFEQFHGGCWTSEEDMIRRSPLAELDPGTRYSFHANVGWTDPGNGTTLLTGVNCGGRVVAAHVWVRQVLPGRAYGERIEFTARVVRYRRVDGSQSRTLADLADVRRAD
jgi:hypothetical protein